VDFKRTGVLKCATIVSITTKVEQELPIKMIQAAFDWDRSAYERALSPECYTFRKAVVDPPPLDFDPIGQNWEDSNTTFPRSLSELIRDQASLAGIASFQELQLSGKPIEL